MRKSDLFGIEELRKAVGLFNNCNETFNQRFTAVELVQLWRMFSSCKWDIAPDRWSEEQIQLALKGSVPTFEDDESPVVLS